MLPTIRPIAHRIARARHSVRLALVRIKDSLPAWALPPLRRAVDLADLPRRGVWRIRNDGPRVPPWSVRSRTGSASLAQHTEVGHAIARDVARILADAGSPLARGIRVLDWGCGSGRVALELLDGNDVDLHGCDVDREAVEWLRRAADGGEARFQVSRSIPPLPFPDGTFDVVYSISVFTHLDANAQLAWLRELRRVTAPGGVLLLSTAGRRSFEQPFWAGIPGGTARELVPRLGGLEEQGFVFVSYGADMEDRPEKYPGISGDFGVAFQSEAWTRDRWSGIVEIDRIVPAAIGGYQDAVVARPAPADPA